MSLIERAADSPTLTGSTAVVTLIGTVAAALNLEGAWAGGASVLLGLCTCGFAGLAVRAKRRDDRSAATRHTATEQTSTGTLPRLDQVAVDRFGIHTPGVALPYLTRDKESELRRELTAGRPVLIVGHSMTGKTRMTHHVARDLYGAWPVFIPARPDGLALDAVADLTGTVIWLDDLEGYLSGNNPRVREGEGRDVAVELRDHPSGSGVDSHQFVPSNAALRYIPVSPSSDICLIS